MSGERTEQPTQRRLDEARRRGEIPRSVEVSGAVGLIVGLLALQWWGGQTLESLQELMRISFTQIGAAELTPQEVHRLGLATASVMARALGPLVGVIVVTGVAVNLAQTQGLFTFKPLAPDFNRINPGRHVAQLLSAKTLVEFAKALTKLLIVGVVAYKAYQERYLAMVGLLGDDLHGTLAMMVQVIGEVAMRAALAYGVLAVADYAYQRWLYQRRMRMTKQELKEDLRQSDGSPEVRVKMRQQARKLARARMMTKVPKADVVVTNPTHLAIAILYDQTKMRAPRVVAKGAGFLAERIKLIATENGVALVENKPLAQALFRTVDVEDEIPVELFEAVAEVLAFVYTLRRRRVHR